MLNFNKNYEKPERDPEGQASLAYGAKRERERERESKGIFSKIPSFLSRRKRELKGPPAIASEALRAGASPARMGGVKGILKITLTSLIAALACTGIIYAATTVGTNISTTGTLTATGLTTMGNASSTLLSVSGTAYIGGATGLILSDGLITDVSGAISFGNENLTTTGTLTITGSTTLEDLIIDVTNTEAFLIRKDGDGGDVFTVDTIEGDIIAPYGSLQRGAKYIVFESSGTVYVVDGKTGEIVNSNATDETAIQWALDNLTAGRDYKEKIILVGDFTLTADIKLSSYTILDMTGSILSADGAVWSSAADPQAIGISDTTNGVDNIEILGGRLEWTYVEDDPESWDDGADTFTMTGHPFSNGDRVFYHANPDDDCGLDSPVNAYGDDYYICNSTTHTVQLDDTSNACGSIVVDLGCTPNGTFRQDPTYGLDGISIKARGGGTMSMPSPTCTGTCTVSDNVTILVDSSCTGSGYSTCRWHGERETVYEIKIVGAGTPVTFDWRAKYSDCPNGDACWSAWSTGNQNAVEASGGVELSHTDTNLLEFSNNLHVIWGDQDVGDVGDIWTVTVPYAENILIQGMTIKGFRSHAISFAGVSNAIVKSNYLSDGGDDGVSALNHSSYFSVLDNKIHGFNSRKGGSSGVEIEDGSAHVSIVGNNMWDMRGVVVILDTGVSTYLAPHHVSIQNNKMESMAVQGNAIYKTKNIAISGNIINGDTENASLSTTGIVVTYTENSTISNNEISNTRFNGISLTFTSKYNTVTGNTIMNCDANAGGIGGYGISLGDSDYNVITNNSIDDSRATAKCKGITLNSTSDYNTITGNNMGRLLKQSSWLSHINNSGTNNMIHDNMNDTDTDFAGAAINLQTGGNTIMSHGITYVRTTGGGGNLTNTLANGQFVGQEKTIQMRSQGSFIHYITIPEWDMDGDDDDNDNCSFDANDEKITLKWDGLKWLTIGEPTCTVNNDATDPYRLIDVDSAEALLVRKNGDSEDVFIVDTSVNRITINDILQLGATSTTPASPGQGDIIYYDAGANEALCSYNGSAWISVVTMLGGGGCP